jgi:outer membrane lipoprotein-sorting protein
MSVSKPLLIGGLVLLIGSAALTTALITSGPARAETPSATEIMEQSKQANQAQTQVSEISMLLIDKKGKEQTRAIQIWSVRTEGEAKSLTRFTKPNKVKGTGFLVHGEGEDAKRWLYMPKSKKTRMIPEGDKDKSFMGTDFTYYDLSPHDIDGSVYDPVVEENVGDVACYKVVGRSKNLDESMYGKVVQWVRQDNFVPIKVDFYDKSGDLLKQSEVLDLQNIGGNWTPMKMQMHNVQINHKTLMTIEEVEFDTEIPDRYFEKSYLERGK